MNCSPTPSTPESGVPARDWPRIKGWRHNLARHAPATEAFERAHLRIERDAGACAGAPCGILHGDLLAGGVLVSTDGRVSGVFEGQLGRR